MPANRGRRTALRILGAAGLLTAVGLSTLSRPAAAGGAVQGCGPSFAPALHGKPTAPTPGGFDITATPTRAGDVMPAGGEACESRTGSE